MIISCPNCNKSFKIDKSLIPDEGRDLQCGSCNHVWFFKIEEDKNEVLKLNEEIVSKNIEIKVENKKEKIKEKKQPPEKISEKQRNKTAAKNAETKGIKFFSYLIVFIISFVALIILLDTLKTPLISVFPRLEIMLFNLFETLQDLKLFIIDLL